MFLWLVGFDVTALLVGSTLSHELIKVGLAAEIVIGCARLGRPKFSYTDVDTNRGVLSALNPLRKRLGYLVSSLEEETRSQTRRRRTWVNKTVSTSGS